MSLMPQLAAIFVTAFVVGLSGAMMPGPLLALTIHESARRGALAGPLLVLGHMLLEAALVLGIALGLATFLKAPAAMIGLSLVGGAVLCWMGQDMMRSATRLSLRTMAQPARSMHPAAAGVLVSLANPYWSLWWATIGFGYVGMGIRFGWVGVATFFAGHILSDFAWYTLVSVSVARGRNLLSDSIYRGLIRLCGLAVILFGLWFLLSGLQTILRKG